MQNYRPLIACRIGCYGEFLDDAWTHLPSLGIRHIETMCPDASELPELRTKLKDHGLVASSLHCVCDIKRDDVVEVLKPQFDLFPEFGTRICFTSVHAGNLPRETVWKRLREIGDAAEARDVVVAMETHPDLVENAKNSRTTMEAVNHPNIRVNFDTANIYYYNEGCSAVDDLRDSVEFVASVHLKDSSGKYRTWDFPALGQGVVDYPGVFQIMSDRGFPGPFTMELEGTEGVMLDRDGCLKHIADSAMYLQSIGVLGLAARSP